jgi:Zn-dependent peptidase ImmA (M78 family)
VKREEIEQAARDIQKEIWYKREVLWPRKRPPLVQMFDVESGAQVLGVQVEKFAYLPWYEKAGTRHQIAGLIDRAENRIALGTNFKPQIVRFTGAHELGHWVLHGDEQKLRDSPSQGLSGSIEKRPPKER